MIGKGGVDNLSKVPVPSVHETPRVNIDRYKTIPINGVPQVTGNMHFGEHNPLFSPAEHIFGEARQ